VRKGKREVQAISAVLVDLIQPDSRGIETFDQLFRVARRDLDYESVIGWAEGMIFHLHGELMAGDRGSMLVELAASWTMVMRCHLSSVRIGGRRQFERQEVFPLSPVPPAHRGGGFALEISKRRRRG
jgi:hypothetical protein